MLWFCLPSLSVSAALCNVGFRYVCGIGIHCYFELVAGILGILEISTKGIMDSEGARLLTYSAIGLR